MSRLSSAQIQAIRDQVAAGDPCPLCKVQIKPNEVAQLGNSTQRCPHCFRIFAVASSNLGMTATNPRHTW